MSSRPDIPFQELRQSPPPRSTRKEDRDAKKVAKFRAALINRANGMHLAGHLVSLEQLAILPQFYLPPAPFDPLRAEEQAEDTGPLNLLPMVPEYPEYLAPYGIPGITIESILRGSQHVAVLGISGSGRTVALALISILTARQSYAEQDGALSSELRTPLLLHTDDLSFDTENAGRPVDILSPLTKASNKVFKGQAASALKWVIGAFRDGNGLLLLDGWDEVPTGKKMQTITWLQLVMEYYPQNRVVITGPAYGFAPLIEAGFAPVFMRPWGDLEIAEFARRWAEAWPLIGGTPKAPAARPSADLVRRITRRLRSLSPLDATLRTWASLAGVDPSSGRNIWYGVYIDRAAPDPAYRLALQQMAQELHFRHSEAGPRIDDMTLLFNRTLETSGRAPIYKTPDFLFTIISQTKLLSERATGSLQFTHPLMRSFLAAESLADSPHRERLRDITERNTAVLGFIASTHDVSSFVRDRLMGPKSLDCRSILDMSRWAANAPPDTPWRAEFFKKLSQWFLANTEFPYLVERIMASLVAAHDQNVIHIFQQGLRSENAHLRMISAVGMGAAGDEESVLPLGGAFDDEDMMVQILANLAMGVIGSKTAINYVLQSLLQGNDIVRRAAGEICAQNVAGEGHEILRDAVMENDPATRKAAIYGLERIRESWAIDLIQDLERNDSDWIVRATATSSLERLRNPNLAVPSSVAPPGQIQWLIDWLENHNQTVNDGERGVNQLVQILKSGNEQLRLAAAETLGHLGSSLGISALYAALKDEHPEIRDAAYRALGAISQAIGIALPGVTTDQESI